jgi:hypothetical protein
MMGCAPTATSEDLMSTSKTNPGNFFEDFELGQVIKHATPRTVTEGGSGAVWLAVSDPVCVAVFGSLCGLGRAGTSPG